jgi:hypothetical protein
MSDLFQKGDKVVFHGTKAPTFDFVEYLTPTCATALVIAPRSRKLSCVFASDLVRKAHNETRKSA